MRLEWEVPLLAVLDRAGSECGRSGEDATATTWMYNALTRHGSPSVLGNTTPHGDRTVLLAVAGDKVTGRRSNCRKETLSSPTHRAGQRMERKWTVQPVHMGSSPILECAMISNDGTNPDQERVNGELGTM